jgi:hypothetical protein
MNHLISTSSGLLSAQTSDFDSTPQDTQTAMSPTTIDQQALSLIRVVENILAGATTLAPVDSQAQTSTTDTSSAVQGTADLTSGTTLSPTPVATDNSGQDQQGDTTSSTTDQGNISQGNDNQATVADNSTAKTQASSDAKVAAAESYDTTNSGLRTGVYSAPSDIPVAASSVTSVTPVASSSLNSNLQLNSAASGSVQPNGRMVVADTAGRDRSSARAIAADIRPAIVRDLYFTNLQDTSHARTDSDPTSNRSSVDVLTQFLNKSRSTEGLADLDRLGLSYDRLAHLDKALAELEWPAPVSERSRRDAAVNLLASEIVFGETAPLKAQDSGAADQGEENEAAPSPVDASARGAGLLGSPLSFDLDSLAQEAQKFFGQIEQMGQDLAGLFGRTNLLSGLVAIGLAASAFHVARRRKQRTAQAIALQGCTDTTFTCYPGLGGTWTWEEK